MPLSASTGAAALRSVRAHARQMQWDPDDFARFTQSESGLQAYNDSTEEAVARQVFGVPTMVVGAEMWWGNDRLFFLEKYLNQETQK